MDKKAVSHVIGGLFVLLIVFLAMTSIYAYHITQDRYNRVVDERHQLDWERINEKISILSAEVVNETLKASIYNDGDTIVRFVSLWLSAYNGSNAPQWQSQYKIDFWLSPGETKYNFGQDEYTYTRIKPGLPGDVVDSIMLLNLEENWWYSMKLVTERGNVAIYNHIPDIFEEEEPKSVGEVDIPIVMYPSWENFQYMDKPHASEVFESAYLKDRSKTNDHVIYRVLVNNTTNSTILLFKNCTMGQISTATGAIQVRYIVSNLTEVWDPTPTPFTSYAIPAGEIMYLYFATEDIDTPGWQNDSSAPASGKNWQIIGFILWFTYEGECYARSISLPPIIQLLVP